MQFFHPMQTNVLFAGVTIEPHKKQLHCSLAYQFPTEKKEKLETLAKAINLKAPVRWDLRLYSRDVLKGKGSYQVRFLISRLQNTVLCVLIY